MEEEVLIGPVLDFALIQSRKDQNAVSKKEDLTNENEDGAHVTTSHGVTPDWGRADQKERGRGQQEYYSKVIPMKCAQTYVY